MNNQELQELLTRVQREPEKASKAELVTAQEFYRSFNKRLNIYCSVHNTDPVVEVVEALLRQIDTQLKT